MNQPGHARKTTHIEAIAQSIYEKVKELLFLKDLLTMPP